MKYFRLITMIFIILNMSHLAIVQVARGDPIQILQTRPGRDERSVYKDGIVARVNGEIVTRSEVVALTAQIQQEQVLVLQFLIREKLILQAARKESLEISDEKLDKILNQRIEKLGGEQQFEKIVLGPMKMSLKEYQFALRRDLLKQKYIMKKFSPDPLDKSTKLDFIIDTFVTPKEIRDYFEAHRSGFAGPLKIRTRQIILLFDDAATKISKQSLGEKILKELAEGADFAHLAWEYSEIKKETGGLWEWIPQGTFSGKVEDIIFSLKVDEISPLIETQNSFRIIKIEDKTTPQDNIDSPELQERIRTVLINKKYQEGQRKIIEELLEQADIWVATERGFLRTTTPRPK